MLNNSVIINPNKAGTWADKAARTGISSAGNTVFNKRFLFALNELVAATSACPNASNGTNPEKTNKVYENSVNPLGLTLNITVYSPA